MRKIKISKSVFAKGVWTCVLVFDLIVDDHGKIIRTEDIEEDGDTDIAISGIQRAIRRAAMGGKFGDKNQICSGDGTWTWEIIEDFEVEP